MKRSFLIGFFMLIAGITAGAWAIPLYSISGKISPMGATVALYKDGIQVGSSTASSITDSTYSFTNLNGTYTVIASKTGYVTDSISGLAATDSNLTGRNLNLTGAYSISGKISPMGTTLALYKSGVQVGSSTTSSVTDSTYSFTGLNGTYTIIASKTGYVTDSIPGLAATDSSLTGRNLNLTGAYSISGKISPMGTTLALYKGGVQVGSSTTSSVTDSTYSFTGLNGTYTVIASKTGYVTDSIPGLAATDSSLTGRNLNLTGAYSISGKISPMGTTLALYKGGVQVGSSTTSSVTDSIYSFTGLNGTYTIIASKTGYVTDSIPGLASTDSSLTGRNLNLAANPTYTVSGIVKNSSKKLKNVTVTLLSGTTAIKTDTTDSLGAYSISGIEAGTYSLTLSKKGYETKDSTPVAVSATVALDTIIVTKVKVSGTVTDSSGTPIKFVQVAFRTSLTSGTSSTSFAYDTTDASGAFSISTDSVGKFYIRTKCMDSATATTFGFDSSTYINQFDTITFPGIDTVITIKKASVIKSTVSGKVTNSSTGSGIQFVVVSVGSYKDTTDSAGEYSVSIPTGVYTITASLTGYTSKSVVDTVTATALTVNFSLVPKLSIKISGIVIDSTGSLMDSVALALKTSAGTTLLRDTTDSDGGFSFTTDSLTGTFLIRAISTKLKDTVWDTLTLDSANIVDTIIIGKKKTRIIRNWTAFKSKQAVSMAGGILKLNNMNEAGIVRMFNTKGELMLIQSFNAGASVNIPVGRKFSTGNYILRITQKNVAIQKNVIIQ